MTLVDRSVRRQFTAAMALAMALALLLSGTALAQTTADEVQAVAIDDSCNDVPEDGFTDVPETNTFDDEIECLKAYGFTEGSGDGTTYEPAKATPRWQMVQFVARVAAEADEQLDAFELPEASDQGFEDIGNLEQRFQDNINIMAEIGVVEGLNATTFDPYSKVKRDQMASFMNRLQGAIQDALGGDPDGFTTGEDFFPDVSDDNVHKDNINGLASVGIVQGKVDGDYDPRENVTRGQMSAFIMRHYEVNVDNGVLTSKYPGSELNGRAGVITVFDTGANTYSFVENGTDDEVKVDYEPGDEFFVDGDPASNALFEDDIDEGDVIEWEERDGEPDAHSLTNTEIESGFIGDFDTTVDEIDVINTVTGDVVDTFTYTGGLFTVDGDSVLVADFEAALNEGDTIEVEDLGETPETFHLTNGTLSGSVDGFDKTADVVNVKLSAGAVIANLPYAGADSYMVDGSASNAAEFEADMTVGDSITHAIDVDGIVSFTLVNMAPSTQTGLAVEDSLADDEFTIVDEDGPTNVDYDPASLPTGTENRFFVDGELVTEAQFEAAGEYTAGDSISFTDADGDNDQNRVIALTNQPLRGTPDNLDSATNTFDVLGPDDETNLVTGETYAATDDLEVNGSDVDEATFEAYLVALEDGVIDGYIEVDYDETPIVLNVVVE